MTKDPLQDSAQAGPIGVLLLTFGSPETSEDVEQYMTNVRRGNRPDPELIAEFQRRYEVIGGSPLVRHTREQVAATASRLQELYPGQRFQPYIGMRFWRPYVPDVIRQMAADGIQRAVALILSPQYSPILMKGYLDAVQEGVAAVEAEGRTMEVAFVETWWEEPKYLQAVAGQIEGTLASLPEEIRAHVPLLLTAHSVPRTVFDRDPDYIRQLQATVEAVAERVDHPSRFAYQSAGHTHEEWLRPDMVDLFPALAAEGHRDVVIAPVQFLSDHLEILYDIDVAAREQAAEAGLTLHRTPSLNTHPGLVDALATVMGAKLEEQGWI